MTATEAMDKTSGSETKGSSRSGSETRPKDQRPPATDDGRKAPKKRRKVNHGELPSRSVSLLPHGARELTRHACSCQPASTAVDL